MHQMFCNAVHFYSKEKRDITSAFLGSIQVANATGKALFQAMRDCFKASKVKLIDYVSFSISYDR